MKRTLAAARGPEWTFHKVGHRWMLARFGWAQGSFASLNAAVAEKQRVTGVNHYRLIQEARSA